MSTKWQYGLTCGRQILPALYECAMGFTKKIELVFKENENGFIIPFMFLFLT